MTAALNQDWEIKPIQRFVAARALIGSAITDTKNHRGSLVLSLEVYGRDQDVDNHAEQRSLVGSSHQTTPVPPLNNDDIWVGTLDQTEGNNISMKLILDAYPFNALITSSMRIGYLVDQPECGPNTMNFVVPPQTNSKYKIYLDSQSWSDSLKLDNNANLNSIYTHFDLCNFNSSEYGFMRLILTLHRVLYYSMDIYSSL